jgi:hypothetical protein
MPTTFAEAMAGASRQISGIEFTLDRTISEARGDKRNTPPS